MTGWLKLLTLILISTLIIRWQNPAGQYLTAISLILILRRRFWPRLRPLLPVLTLIVITQLLLARPAAGLTAAAKIINLSCLVLIYTLVTPVRQISRTFAFLGKNAQLLITLTFSLVPVIVKEWQTIVLVQKARGCHSLSPLPIIVPLLHRTLRRAEQLALVLSLSATGLPTQVGEI